MDDEIPAAVLLVRDFVNTAEPQLGTDQLAPATAGECLEKLGLVASGVGLAPDDLPLLIGVREGLRALLADHTGHDNPDVYGTVAPGRAELDDLLRNIPLTLSLGSGTPTLSADRGNPAHQVVAAVLSAVVSVPTQEWVRLKVCARGSCRWAFYDSSRNRSGRWCSTAGCGNIVKMRRARRTTALG